MSALPQGTVTFLFTDVEGSTRLLHELGDGYAAVLAEHRRVLREAFAHHGGVEVDTQGDAFFVAFAKASDALAAAEEGRAALEGGPIRVRMGLHSGEPIVTDEGYVGIDVHRAARIASVGYGGQILVSQSTRELADADGLRDLGAHRLKDLLAPERIFQLGEGEFPPLKSLNATNLPVASSPLVGRQSELAELQGLLGDGIRIVTLTGAGGSGKTRLALQLAAEVGDSFPGGVFFVPLAGVGDPGLVEGAIGSATGLRSLEELSDRTALLVIDNFEHLLPAAAVIASFVAETPNTKVVVTSRSPLRIAGEHEYAIDPLSENDAVALLTERARAVRPDFVADEAAREICRRLDGLPLALELAAARLRSIGSDALLERLERRLPVLTSGRRDAPERQQTLRATIEWSFDLLPPPLQNVFMRLGVFAGTFSLRAAEAVADADLDAVDALVEASLLKPVGTDRFLMLETIREFAADLLETSTEGQGLRDRHLDFFLNVVVSAEPELSGARQKELMELLSLDEDNIREALGYACDSDDAERAQLLAGSNWRFWHLRAQMVEATNWYERALSLQGEVSARAHARAVYGLGEMERDRGNLERAHALLESAISLLREAEERRWLISAMNHLANAHSDVGRSTAARRLYEEALQLARDLGDESATAMITGNLGFLALAEGRDEDAAALLAQAEELDRKSGVPTRVAGTLVNVALISLRRDDTSAAGDQIAESLSLSRSVGTETAVFEALLLAAVVLERRGDPGPGLQLQAAARALAAAREYVVSAVELTLADQSLAALRAAMPPDVAESEWRQGEGLDLRDAVNLALSSLDP